MEHPTFGVTILVLRYGTDIAFRGLFEPQMPKDLEPFRAAFRSKPTICLISEMVEFDPILRPTFEIVEQKLKSNQKGSNNSTGCKPEVRPKMTLD